MTRREAIDARLKQLYNTTAPNCPLSCIDIARAIQVSPQYVGQIEQSAMQKLRKKLKHNHEILSLLGRT